MKTRTLIIFIFLSSFYLRSFSQSIDFLLGDAVESDLGTMHFIDFDDSIIYTMQINEKVNKRYHLELYDRLTLNRTSNISIPFPDVDSVQFHIEYLNHHNRVYNIFYSYYNWRFGGVRLEAITFNEKGEKIEQPKLLHFLKGSSEKNAGEFKIFKGNNNQIIARSSVYRKDTTDIQLTQYDCNLNITGEHNFKLEKFFGTLISSFMDTSGNLSYFSTSNPELEQTTLQLKVFDLKSDSTFNIVFNKPSKSDIYLSPLFSFLYSKDGLLNILTTYFLNSFSKRSLGFYWARIDPINHVLVKEKFLTFENFNLSNINIKDFESKSCRISNLNIEDNKKYSLNFENISYSTSTFYSIPLSHEISSGNMVKIILDSLYTPLDLLILKKDQDLLKNGMDYCGYLSLRNKNTSFYLFNDLRENIKVIIDKPKQLRTSLLKNALITYVVVKEQQIVKKSVPAAQPGIMIQGLIQPYKSIQLSDEELVSIVKDETTGLEWLVKFFIGP